MAARVSDISDLSASAWASKKPKNYKGSDLDKALKAWEALKPVKFPDGLLPEVPDFKLSKIEGCAAMITGAIKDIEKLKKEVEERVKALKAVTTAGSKAASELKKLSSDKKLSKEESQEYWTAYVEADGLSSKASFFSGRDFE